MRSQALLFVHSALTVGQPGKITRLVSGCRDDAERLAARRSVLEPAASAYFVAELPPSLAAYKYANRPYALREWLLHSGEQLSGHVAICDPDMVLLAPLVVPSPQIYADLRAYAYGQAIA